MAQKINSRSKGNRNERKVAKIFEEWTNKKFARTPSSGGLNWKSSHAKGDIVCTTEGHWFPFCVEVKAHRDINFEHLLYNNTPKIFDFWNQCSEEAEKARKEPLLLMRYDKLPSSLFFLALRSEFYNHIIEYFPNLPHLRFHSNEPNRNIVIVNSVEFFSNVPYKPIKKFLRTLYKNG